MVVRMIGAFNVREWDAMAAFVAPDHDIVDHRRVVSLPGGDHVKRDQGFGRDVGRHGGSVEPLAELHDVLIGDFHFAGDRHSAQVLGSTPRTRSQSRAERSFGAQPGDRGEDTCLLSGVCLSPALHPRHGGLAADARPNAEMIGEFDGIGMVRIVWSGHLDDGGGPFELSWRGVIVAHDDVIVRYQLFDWEGMGSAARGRQDRRRR